MQQQWSLFTKLETNWTFLTHVFILSFADDDFHSLYDIIEQFCGRIFFPPLFLSYIATWNFFLIWMNCHIEQLLYILNSHKIKGNSKWVVHEFGIYLQSNRTSKRWCAVIFWLNILHKPYLTYLTFLFCICQNKLHTQPMMSPKNKILLHHMGGVITNNWLLIY